LDENKKVSEGLKFNPSDTLFQRKAGRVTRAKKALVSPADAPYHCCMGR